MYSYLKLPYGVKSSPKIFQAKMGQILQGIEKRVCKQDDILVGGNDWQENLKILAEVLDRLHKYKLQNLKCSATSGRENQCSKESTHSSQCKWTEIFPRHGAILSFFPARATHNAGTLALTFSKGHPVEVDTALEESF